MAADVGPEMTRHDVAPTPRVGDARLSVEFQRRLARYMGGDDPTSIFADRYRDWYEDHAGRRSEWFRSALMWRLERDLPLAGARVLDFGCGTGSSTVVLAEHGARVVGAETEQVSLEVAAQRVKDLQCADRCALVRIPYLTGERSHLPLRDESFDLCTLIGVVEHMKPHEREACIAEIYRVLRPGGRVFIFDTPNRAFPKDLHTTQLWFAGWMPEEIARRYAIVRKRFDARQDFQRYGGNGVSRRRIDRLFPPHLWQVSYEKSTNEVALELVLWSTAGLASRVGRPLLEWSLRLLALFGARPTFWTSSHSIGFTKRPGPRPDEGRPVASPHAR